MIAVSSHPVRRSSNTVSFASTLYLLPVLDLLLEKIPARWQPEIRLGLQEALVNAAKHGNKLDPCKTVLVRFDYAKGCYRWTIADQGPGFCPPQQTTRCLGTAPCVEQECGRGLHILYQIFDSVEWNATGNELRLSKQVDGTFRLPLFS